MSVRDEESKVHPIYETAGWVGAALLLLAYGLAVTQAVPVTDARSLVMNALGSLGIIVISARKQTWQPLVVNVVWLLIAANTLIHQH